MLTQACERWLAAGRLTRLVKHKGKAGEVASTEVGGRGCRYADATELDHSAILAMASHPNVTPALMELGINRADQPKINKPFPFLRKALGVGFDDERRPLPPLTPYLTEQAIVDKWEQMERKIADGERAKAALTRMADRAMKVPVVVDVEASRSRLAEQAELLRRRAAAQKGA
jgi:hypothetical protein